MVIPPSSMISSSMFAKASFSPSNACSCDFLFFGSWIWSRKSFKMITMRSSVGVPFISIFSDSLSLCRPLVLRCFSRLCRFGHRPVNHHAEYTSGYFTGGSLVWGWIRHRRVGHPVIWTTRKLIILSRVSDRWRGRISFTWMPIWISYW